MLGRVDRRDPFPVDRGGLQWRGRPFETIWGVIEMTAVRGSVRSVLRLEGVVVAAVSVMLYYHHAGGWLMFVLLFLTPDLSMLGYFAGPRVGAVAYNLVHAYISPFVIGRVGVLADAPLAVLLALIWTAHIGFDRALGYGLKYATAFGDTHLGRLGRELGSQ